jgi:hypothetical protein
MRMGHPRTLCLLVVAAVALISNSDRASAQWLQRQRVRSPTTCRPADPPSLGFPLPGSSHSKCLHNMVPFSQFRRLRNQIW